MSGLTIRRPTMRPMCPAAFLLVAAALFGATTGGCASGPSGEDEPIPERPKESEQWERAINQAQNMEERGEYDSAEDRYETLREVADEADERRYAALQLAQLHAERGNPDEALAGYKKLWEASVDDAHGARAIFEGSQLVEQQDQLECPTDTPDLQTTIVRDLPCPQLMQLKLVRRYPASMWAERGVEQLADYYVDRGNWSGLTRAFEALHEAVRETEVADDVLFEAGLRFRNDRGDRETALGYFRRLLDAYPEALLADDAAWEAADICVARQDWACALPLLTDLSTRVRQTIAAPKLGTENSPYASKATYRLGFLHLTHLDAYGAAADHFRRYLSEFPDNRRADDSAWHLAHAYRLADERKAYRRALRDLIERYPKSRYADRARRELEGSP
jgi:TolA-binding protein